MSKDGSYRQILRSSSIIGGASVINIAVGLLRIKVAAVLLGPAGVGLIGLLTNLAGTASAVAGLGVGNVGTRQIAEAVGRNDAAAMAAARRALFLGSLVLALLGAAVFWALRGVLAARVLGEGSLAGEVGWLALVVGLTVAAASQTALLNGMRQIGDLARVTVLSALLSTLLGIGALMLWGRSGLVAFLIAAPLASFLLGHVYVARLPKVQAPRTPLSVLVGQWRVLARLGAAFMVAGLAVTLGQLLARTLVQRQLGADALGYFQAAATISMTYIGFVLTAMGTDYYPRLTAAIHDHAAVNRMVNEQTEVALLLAGPVFLAMMGLAPWVIDLLYSQSFHPAAEVLRWQVLGDILKVVSWPLGFIILAAGNGRTFMLTETLAVSVFVILTWLGLPLMGVAASGMAFFAMYAVYLPMVYWLARRRTGFRWARGVVGNAMSLLLVGALVLGGARWYPILSAVFGVVAACGFLLHSLIKLAHVTNLPGSLGKIANFSRRVASKMASRSN
ncbi:polysaccharide biosynthesis protein [Acidovorax sp. SRB_14]|uniref:O-antigen translocase n=1 Tax=Acidovorax sp. SRB_14 TaxID=1962699 RepID=UPI0015660E16|nr:O-antigen translocase [Acidovorax sp. SRB_14]NMM81604.1 polysaccharide biosynthesis protein [Acidovorax sp. SRB_14]